MFGLRGERAAASARGKKCRAHALAPLPSGHKAKIRVGLARSRASGGDPTHSRSSKSTRSFQAPAMRFALPALVCFAIQVKTQIQGTAVAQRAWPNPSIERTRNGMAHLAFISFWAKRAMPLRAAHVKR